MKRIFHLACALAAVFSLGAAVPALAHDCGNCAECPKHKAAAADPKAGEEKKAEKKEAKPDEKAPPAATPAPGEKKAEGAPKCECEKGGKGCVCKKGECKCANCGAAKLSAAGDEKPKCECDKGKDCACKGECKCSHAPKKA